MANLAEATSPQQFEELLQKAGKSLVVVHFLAPWAPQCTQMNDVMAELAKENAQVTFVKLEAEAVPEVSEKYEISSVPTFLFFKVSVVNSRSLVVVHFLAPWAPQCTQMNDVMAELAKENAQVTFVKLEAEAVPEVSEKYEISSVPTFLFFKNNQKVDRLDGAHAPELTKKVQRLSSAAVPMGTGVAAKEDLNERLKKLVNAAPCMLFMKGSPQEPCCGKYSLFTYLLSEVHRNTAGHGFDLMF
ncbi:UNVERIFIED_CONTAM: hypothetical protein FKN15_077963 [Acipenser sinensis]